MATQDLGFNVFALDRASKTFIRLADRIEKVSDKLDELDRKRANPQIDLKVDDAKIRSAVRHIADVADDEGGRRSGGFFRSMFTPNRSILMALRTGIPAVLSSPVGAAAIVLGGVFVASFAAAVLSSGVFAAIGGGFTAIAAIALKENAQLQQSFTALGETAKRELSAAALVLVPAFDAALTTVRGMFGEHIAAPLEDIFRGLGPTIVPFVESAVRTVGDILSTIASPQVTQAMQTVLGAITSELPRLGESLSGFFVTIASNADDIAEAFGDVVTVTGGLIGFAADATNAFTDLFNQITDVAGIVSDLTGLAFGGLAPAIQLAARETRDWDAAVADWNVTGREFTDALKRALGGLEEWNVNIFKLLGHTDTAAGNQAKFNSEIQGMLNAMPTAAEESERLAVAQEKLAGETDRVNDSIDAEQDKLDELKDTMFAAAEGVLGLRESTREYQEQLDVTRETLEKNGQTLDVNTEKGRANQDAIDDIAASALSHIEAMIEQGKSTQQVSKFTQQAREDFIDAARAAGLEKDEAKALADQLGLVPSEVVTKIKAIDEMSATIRHLRRQIRALQREASIVPIGASIRSFFGASHLRSVPVGHDGGMITPTGIRRMHTGGMLRPDERVVIGQTGERILSRRQTRAFEELTGGMGGDGASAAQESMRFTPSQQGPQVVELRITGSGVLYELIHAGVRKNHIQLRTSDGAKVTVG